VNCKHRRATAKPAVCKLQFRPNFYVLGGSWCLSNPGQIWHKTVHTWSTMTRQISSECVHCVPTPLTNERQIWSATAVPDQRYTLTCQISSDCIHCRLPVAKSHNFGQIL